MVKKEMPPRWWSDDEDDDLGLEYKSEGSAPVQALISIAGAVESISGLATLDTVRSLTSISGIEVCELLPA